MGKPIETRADFQNLAEVRLAEAKSLLDLRMWDGAYYLAGYAIELGLKACIIKWVQANDKFLESDFSRRCYTHDIKILLGQAELTNAWQDAGVADPEFLANGKSVVVWSEQTRYQRVPESDARNLYDAISNTTHGVLRWIRLHW